MYNILVKTTVTFKYVLVFFTFGSFPQIECIVQFDMIDMIQHDQLINQV